MESYFGLLKYRQSESYYLILERFLFLLIFLFLNRSTLKNLFLFATSNYVIVGSVDSNSNQLHVSFYSKQNGSHAGKVTIPWSLNINDSQK